MPLKPKAQVKRKWLCSGGPWDRHHLNLISPSTLIFQIGKWRGRYVKSTEVYSVLFWKNYVDL
jgi:hypothetical protein